MSKTLKTILQNDNFLAVYNEALSSLHRIGIFDFLKERGQPQIIEMGKDVHVMATQAARSAGYMEAINDLLNFREFYLDTSNPLARAVPDYGALDLALKRGDIDEEEANAIRTGTRVNYTAESPKWPKPTPG